MVHQSAGLIQIIGGAGIIVKMVLLLLLFFSVASWTIIVIKFRLISRSHRESLAFIDRFWKSRNLSDAFSDAKKLKESSVARVFKTGYIELRKLNSAGGVLNATNGESPGSLGASYGTDNISRTLRRATSSEISRMVHLIPFLATAGSTAPFIGLFGTVWGIMNSFRGIASKGSASLAVVAPGIAEALVATAVGLAVAIPSVIAFNYFSQKIRTIEAELNNFSADFLNIVERDIIRQKGLDQ